MSDHILATIEELQGKIKPMEDKVIKTKQLINLLCEQADISPIYPEAELSSDVGPFLSGTSDEYFNKPLNTCLKSVLVKRKTSGRGPATVEEIYDAMIRGNYQKFPSNKEEALTGLRISLGKSSHTFVRLPNGSYGLGEWYDIKRPKAAKPGEKPIDSDQVSPEPASEPEAAEEGIFSEEVKEQID